MNSLSLCATAVHAMRACSHSSRCVCCQQVGTAVQEVLGKHMLEQQGLTRSFLSLRVDALRDVVPAECEELARYLTHSVMPAGSEIDVRAADMAALAAACAVTVLAFFEALCAHSRTACRLTTCGAPAHACHACCADAAPRSMWQPLPAELFSSTIAGSHIPGCVQLLQQAPPVFYIVQSGCIAFEALAKSQAPSAGSSSWC